MSVTDGKQEMSSGPVMSAVLRGATVVDGTGQPGEQVDVAIEGGRIAAVGSKLDTDLPGVDLSGLVLAPGFIDPHTHYDAQLFWDPAITPSSWYGVTTVVTGNCGFTVAPTRPQHRDIIIETLENVEGMTPETLRAGMDWEFETFPDYLRSIDALPKQLNVASMIGHTALRWYVLGKEATERVSTPEERDRICSLVAEALAEGAIGFSTSLAEHVGAFGKPVPSRAADRAELEGIAATLKRAQQGTMEIVIGGGFLPRDVLELATRAGRPVTWSGRVILPTEPEEFDAARAAVDETVRPGGQVYPQFACLPIVSQVTLLEPAPLRSISPGFLEILGVPPAERIGLYQDPDWRRRTREGIDPHWKRRLATATVQESTVHAALRNGPTLGELAAERGMAPIDLLVDLALEEQLATRFRVPTTNTLEPVVEAMLTDDRCLLGLSDAGAHVTQMCDATYAPHLLGHWVRERKVLSLEQAIWRLTSHPAQVYGIQDRGRIAVGYAADLVAFDRDRIATQPVERTWDFPNHTDRLVARSTGVEHVWVNGVRIRAHGQQVEGTSAGRLLRHGRG